MPTFKGTNLANTLNGAYDADGSGLDATPVLIATLNGVTTLSFNDFSVI